MANLLGEKPLAPEFIQTHCESEHLLPPLKEFFRNTELADRIKKHYTKVHESLIMDTDQLAAEAVLKLWKEKAQV